MPDDKFTLNKSWSSPKGGRCTVEVKSTPITIDLSQATVGRPVAEAIAQVIREAIASIPPRAGKTAQRAFNRTGTLVRGIAARLGGDEWSIAAPPDRLTRDPAIIERLIALVPLLRNPSQIMAHPLVRAARERVLAAMIKIEGN